MLRTLLIETYSIFFFCLDTVIDQRRDEAIEAVKTAGGTVSKDGFRRGETGKGR